MKNIDIKEYTSETLSLSVSAEICISCFFPLLPAMSNIKIDLTHYTDIFLF